MTALIPAAASDRYFDYCLEPYRPRREWRNKYKSENLLWQSLSAAGAIESLREPIEAVQRSLGADLTVWGVKWDGTRLWWELYFYDPEKEAPEATLSALRETLAPWLSLTPRVPESVPYKMLSFDLFAESAERRVIPEVNLYLTGENAHAGRSYKLRESGVELENTYRFMEPKRHVDEVLSLVKSSVFVDYTDPKMLARVLIPELFACKKVCVSKKRTCDAIYFSGIAVDQLLWFCRRFGYPPALTVFLERNAERFEHLFFDVGLDYRLDAASGGLVYPKTSFYGIL